MTVDKCGGKAGRIFCSFDRESEGWWGPFKTNVEAIGFARLNDDLNEHEGCFVTTGQRATKDERECHDLPYSINPDEIVFVTWKDAIKLQRIGVI